MITEEDALNALGRMHSGDDKELFVLLREIGNWAVDAREALERGDVQCVKACLGVIMQSCGVCVS